MAELTAAIRGLIHQLEQMSVDLVNHRGSLADLERQMSALTAAIEGQGAQGRHAETP